MRMIFAILAMVTHLGGRAITTILRQHGGYEMHHSINRSFEFSSNRERFGSAAASSRSADSATAVAIQSPEICVDLSDRMKMGRGCEADESLQTPPSVASELRSLASLLPKCRFFSGSDVHFHSIAASAETCLPGQLVVYRIGLDCPEELICDALARGAAGILTEQILPVPLPQCIVGDTDRALAEIAVKDSVAETGVSPDQRLLTVGIVGDSGKGTTALCLAAILRDVPCRVAYQTDLGHSDGITKEVAQHTSHTSTSLIEHLTDAADAGAVVSVFELDASVLRRGGYDKMGLDVLVITSSSAERADFGPSAVLCALERVRRDGIVVIGSEDQRSLSAVREAGLPCLTFGVNTNADVSLQTISVQDGVLTGMIRHEMNSAIMESYLGQGVFTQSLAAAAAVGVATNNPLVQIAESLSGVRELPGRCQNIASDDWNVSDASPKMLLDVAGSPKRMEMVLRAIGEQNRAKPAHVISMNARVRSSATKRAKVWCVLAISSTDDDDTLARYGRLLETMADHCVLTCDAASKERFLTLSHSVLDGIQDCAAIRLVTDQERAIAWAAHNAQPRDTIVVLGGVDRHSAQTQRDDLQRLNELMKKLQRDVAGVLNKPAPKQALKLHQPEA